MKLSEYFKLLKEEEVARRYFVVNTFDGALTILGIISAIYISGTRDAAVIIISGMGAAIAIAVSGIWGAYAIERAERMKSLRELEMHLMRDLDETTLERRAKIVTIMIALVDGLSPLLISIIIIAPFFASNLGLLNIETAYYFSMIIIALTLFILGIFVSKVAKESIIRGGAKMLLAGVIVYAITFLLDYAKVLHF
jgi:predicted membrane protein (TIGR00267 family)